MNKYVALIPAFLFSLTLFGQHLKKYEAILTSDNFQRWVIDSASVHLGSKCEGGIVLTFILKDKKIQKRTCQNGRWETYSGHWKVKVDNNHYFLEITDGTHLEIDHVRLAGKERLRLRGRIVHDKSEAVSDYFFRKD